MRITIPGAIAVLAALSYPPPAVAQASSTDQVPPGCEAQPGKGGAKVHPRTTDKLSDCGGVLKPPKVDDPMAKQPPEDGNMPVERPEDLPPQQKPQ